MDESNFDWDKYLERLIKSTRIIECGHCGNKSDGKVVASYDNIRSFSYPLTSGNIVGGGDYEAGLVWELVLCPNCDGVNLRLVDYHTGDEPEIGRRAAKVLYPTEARLKTATSLRKHLATITDSDARGFVEEGIKCFEHHLYRSAVILTWVGAVSLLQVQVINHYLDEFNQEAKKRNVKWRVARTSDDLSRMREYDFLQIIEKLSIIGKSTKQQLEQRLQLRNGCGHPNTLRIADNAVANHIEVLIFNVFAKFEVDN